MSTHDKRMTREEMRAYLDTAAGFLSERREWMRVTTAPGEGSGFDVVLRIDGTYSDRAAAEDVADFFREWIERLTDVEQDRWMQWQASTREDTDEDAGEAGAALGTVQPSPPQNAQMPELRPQFAPEHCSEDRHDAN